MRVKHIAIKNLFGVFDHQIPINMEEGITIIYGPNGFGKTCMLKLVNALFQNDTGEIGKIPFSELTVGFDNQSVLRIVKRGNGFTGVPEVFYFTSESKPVKFTLDRVSKEFAKKIHVRFIDTRRLVRISDEEKDRLVLEEFSDDVKGLLGDRSVQTDEITAKIELLLRIINGKFIHKHMEINNHEGFMFTTSGGKVLQPEHLSSGEQHTIVLFYVLIFKVLPDSLILIDEPELSLHVYWQQQFLKDLEDIIKLARFDVILATHSPQIIHDRWDLAVELKGPEA